VCVCVCGVKSCAYGSMGVCLVFGGCVQNKVWVSRAVVRKEGCVCCVCASRAGEEKHLSSPIGFDLV
jgi:hypothetical protein